MSEHEFKIQQLYKKIKSKLEREICKILKEKNILPNESYLTLRASFREINRWKMSTLIYKEYTKDNEYISKEELTYVRGMFALQRYDIEMEPAFRFAYDVVKKTISFSIKEIEDVIREDKRRQDWDTIDMSDNKALLNATTIFDKEREAKIAKLKTEMTPVLESLQFPEDERNLMVLGALEHPSFTEDMSLENVIGLALKVRGQLMQSRS